MVQLGHPPPLTISTDAASLPVATFKVQTLEKVQIVEMRFFHGNISCIYFLLTCSQYPLDPYNMAQFILFTVYWTITKIPSWWWWWGGVWHWMMMMMMARVFLQSHKRSNWVDRLKATQPSSVEQELCGGPQVTKVSKVPSYKWPKYQVTFIRGTKSQKPTKVAIDPRSQIQNIARIANAVTITLYSRVTM